MYISKLNLVNYRNFSNARLLFQKGINTIIGENGSGKTNLFRSIRLLLDDYMIRSAYRLDATDFHRGLGRWEGHWIIISLEFKEISKDESVQALFCHGTGIINDNEDIEKATYNLIFRPKKDIRIRLSELSDGDRDGLKEIQDSVTIDNYETIFTGKSEADFYDKDCYKKIVGDFENVLFNKETEFPEIGIELPKVLSISKEISFTFVQALRDVISEFHNNKTNPLLSLLKSKSGDINATAFQAISDSVKQLNTSIEALDDVKKIQTDIQNTIKDAAGEAYAPASLSIKSDLSDEANKLFQSLKLFVGEAGKDYEGPIHELSLGGANLIFLTLKLLEFKYQKAKQSIANFLLIEEPEAHIHTHIQKTLFDRLRYDNTQIIYSTHSTHISEVSNVKNVNILSREHDQCKAYQPHTGLTEEETGNVQRYLDAVRSNLLFAKSVILVEGDAEEILIPILIKKVMGVSLDELGISLINIRSTGFQNVAVLFHNDRIQKKCSIITDWDQSIIDTTPLPSDSEDISACKKKYAASQNSGSERKTRLEGTFNDNPWVSLFFASHTFEVDFIKAGNANTVIQILPVVYKSGKTIDKSKIELQSDDIGKYGKRILTIANQEGKGWFAVLLGKKIDPNITIPEYILKAISFVLSDVSNKVWFNILSYRLNYIKGENREISLDIYEKFERRLGDFRKGQIQFDDMKKEMLTSFS